MYVLIVSLAVTFHRLFNQLVGSISQSILTREISLINCSGFSSLNRDQKKERKEVRKERRKKGREAGREAGRKKGRKKGGK